MGRQTRRQGEPELFEGMRLLDRYSILDRIGSGGMATIYRATDERLERVVCVKLLRTTLVEGSGSTSGSRAVYKATYTHFLQEALALSKLQHPNTLRIFDFGYMKEDDGEQGAPFHVSEYLDGGNLESHVRLRGALPTNEAIGILEGICGACAEAHEHNIIHRDIKPSNILFARVRGELVSKLADFGIAHSNVPKKQPETRDDGFGESVSTVALFSPRWAAPEQLCGSPEGPRTDVYALGLLAIFMLSGTVLFGDDDVRLTFNDRVRGDTLVDSRIRQLGLSGDVARVLGKALLARPEDRISNAPDFAQRLREALKMKNTNSVRPFPVEVVKRTAEMPGIAESSLKTNDPPRNIPRDDEDSIPTNIKRAPTPEPAVPPPPPTPAPVPAPAPPPSQPQSQSPSNVRSTQMSGSGSSGLPRPPQPPPQPPPPPPPQPPPPAERSGPQIAQHIERRLRYTQVHEKLDLSVADPNGEQVRFRVTMLPGAKISLNVKGLSCFVAKHGKHPTPALTVTQDMTVDLVSTARQILGEVAIYFGQSTQQGRLFVVDGKQVLVTYAEAQQVVVLVPSRGDDIIVMCRS
ncbi:MAG: serine/threonine-protein kinase [Labilithrix sp.]